MLNVRYIISLSPSLLKCMRTNPMVKDDKVVEVSTPLGPCNCLTVLGV